MNLTLAAEYRQARKAAEWLAARPQRLVTRGLQLGVITVTESGTYVFGDEVTLGASPQEAAATLTEEPDLGSEVAEAIQETALARWTAAQHVARYPCASPAGTAGLCTTGTPGTVCSACTADGGQLSTR
jgi:hypothetical protein